MKNGIPATFFAALLASATAYAQETQDKPAPAAASSKDDIVVKGRHGDEEEQAPRPLSAEALVAGRTATADAHQFVRCIHHVDPDLLRPIVEGISRESAAQKALDRVIRINVGCYPGYARSPLPNYFGTCNPIILKNDFKRMCRAVFDRGALIESALAEYAPHFMLTRADTLGEAAIARFQAREKVRGKYRGPLDRRSYLTIACMVQLEPERATRMLRVEAGGADETRLREQILEAGQVCTGSAKRVSIDPFQFRGYVADTLYHWTLAAKNVETLIAAN